MTHDGEKVTEPGGTEAVGHEMGRRILQLKATKQADLTEDDHAAMRKVVGYVHRHSKQRPGGDIADTRWAQVADELGARPAEVTAPSSGEC